MNVTDNMRRRERREYTISQEVLKKLITKYFENCIAIMQNKYDAIKIIEQFNKSNSMWRMFAGKYNASNHKHKSAFLLIDAFESAVRDRSHINIKQSNESYETKLQMLACVYPVQNKSRLYFFFRDCSVRFGYLWETYIS